MRQKSTTVLSLGPKNSQVQLLTIKVFIANLSLSPRFRKYRAHKKALHIAQKRLHEGYQAGTILKQCNKQQGGMLFIQCKAIQLPPLTAFTYKSHNPALNLGR